MFDTTPQSQYVPIQDFITPQPSSCTHWFHHAVSEASKTVWFIKSRRTVLTGLIFKSLSANRSLLQRDPL